MNTEPTKTQAVENRAIVLQCLVSSVSLPKVTIGEIVKFNGMYGKNHMSRYQVERLIHELVREKLVDVSNKKDKRQTRVYAVTAWGIMAVMSMHTFLPKRIRDVQRSDMRVFFDAAVDFYGKYQTRDVNNAE